MKTVFIHPERCIGCKQCEAACAVAHSQSKSLFWAVFENPTPKPRIHAEPGPVLNSAFPNKCRHCNPAPCTFACPTGALQRDSNLIDIILVEARKCIACGMCAIVCPFDAITYYPTAEAIEKASVAIKCDHCIERQRDGLEPACVEVCKVGALEFGEVNELVKAARTKYSEFVSVAVGRISTEISEVPQNVDAWREWGLAVRNLNEKGKKGA